MKCKYAKRLLAVAVATTMLATSFSGNISVSAETTQETEADSIGDQVTAPEAEAVHETEQAPDGAAGTEATGTGTAGIEAGTQQETTVINEEGKQPEIIVNGETETQPEDTADTESESQQNLVLQDAAPEDQQPEQTQVEQIASELKEESSADGQFDTTAPIIESISIDKQGQTVGESDTFKVSVKAYDQDSDIQEVKISLTSEGTSHYYLYSYPSGGLNYNETTGCYETTRTVSNSGFHGKTYLSEVSATDTAGNVVKAKVANPTQPFETETSANADNALYWMNVNRNDNEKPVVHSIQIAEAGKTVTVGDQLHITMKATDNVALSSSVWVSFSEKKNTAVSNSNKYQSAWLTWDDNAQCYTGTLDITDKTFPGTWGISGFSVDDTSGNRAEAKDVEGMDQTVIIQHDGYDMEAPKIKSLTMDKVGATLTAGDQVKLTTEVSDNVGVDSVKLTLRNINGEANVQNDVTCYMQNVAGTDKYECTYTITDKDYPCEWYVANITANDTYGNSAYVYSTRQMTGSTDESYRPLNYDYYFNVTQNGTFVAKNCQVSCNYLNADMKWESKVVEVPRRTTLAQLKQIFTPDVKLQGANFTGWRMNSDVPILGSQYIYAKYDKNLIEKYIYYYDGEVHLLYSDCFFAAKGDKIDLPKALPGIKNIEWYIGDLKEEIKNDSFIVSGDDDEYYLEADGEPDGTTPPKDNKTDDDKNNKTDDKKTDDTNEGIKLPTETIRENVDKINSAKEGDKITVSMGDATVAPKDVLEAAKGKDIDIVLDMNGYKWTINGKNIKSDNLKDINLAVNTNSNAIPSNVVSSLAGSNPVKQISLAYSGDFGFQASLSYNIGSEYAGKYGNLYYYDSTGRMIFQNAGAIGADGTVSLKFSHASDYAVVITDTPQIPGSQAQSNDQNPTGSVQNLNKANTTKAPNTGDNNDIVFYFILCGMGIAAVAVITRKKRNA
ncbi:MAG: hypothetical protein MR427_06155 [Roseburia sp.]|nr:hypothetical protein [Roseburia sp.]